MAIITIALGNTLTLQLGAIPPALATAVAPLTATQRDQFVSAWVNAPTSQRSRDATQWVITEADRAAFETFRTTMNAGAS